MIRTTTIITDLILINLGFLLAYIARYVFQWFLPTTFIVPYQDYISQQLLLNLLLIVTFSQNRVWRRRRGEFWLDEVSRLSYAAATGVAPLAHVLQIAALIDVTRQRDPGFSGSRCVRGFVE